MSLTALSIESQIQPGTDGAFYLTITTSVGFGSSWTSPAVKLDATNSTDAQIEAINVTANFAKALTGGSSG